MIPTNVRTMRPDDPSELFCKTQMTIVEQAIFEAAISQLEIDAKVYEGYDSVANAALYLELTTLLHEDFVKKVRLIASSAQKQSLIVAEANSILDHKVGDKYVFISLEKLMRCPNVIIAASKLDRVMKEVAARVMAK